MKKENIFYSVNVESKQTVPVSKLNAAFLNTCTLIRHLAAFRPLLNCTSPCGPTIVAPEIGQDLQCKSCRLLELNPQGEVRYGYKHP